MKRWRFDTSIRIGTVYTDRYDGYQYGIDYIDNDTYKIVFKIQTKSSNKLQSISN